MDAFSHHVLAAARCVEIRGPNQFRNEISTILVAELQRLIVCIIRLSYLVIQALIYGRQSLAITCRKRYPMLFKDGLNGCLPKTTISIF